MADGERSATLGAAPGGVGPHRVPRGVLREARRARGGAEGAFLPEPPRLDRVQHGTTAQRRHPPRAPSLRHTSPPEFQRADRSAECAGRKSARDDFASRRDLRSARASTRAVNGVQQRELRTAHAQSAARNFVHSSRATRRARHGYGCCERSAPPRDEPCSSPDLGVLGSTRRPGTASRSVQLLETHRLADRGSADLEPGRDP